MIPGSSGHDQIDGEKRFDVTITKMYTVRNSRQVLCYDLN